MDFQQRLEETRKKNDVNCCGTALYLAGLADYESIHPKSVVDDFLSRMPKTQEPVNGCVVVFRYPQRGTWVKHMSVLTGTEPKTVTHRLHGSEPLTEDQDLEQLMADCGVGARQVEYYEPRFRG